jgi:hypothetical protein
MAIQEGAGKGDPAGTTVEVELIVVTHPRTGPVLEDQRVHFDTQCCHHQGSTIRMPSPLRRPVARP